MPELGEPSRERMKKYSEENYPKYLEELKKKLDAHRIGVGQYTKEAWPKGYKAKTRNAKAPKGKRWGHWDGGEAP